MITFHFQEKIKKFSTLRYKKWIQQLILSKGVRLGELSYIFTNDEAILKINQQYLRHDNYTDIITFNYNENNIISGDIFISIERVRENAEIYEVSFDNELLRVMAHGILHLCGFNDETEQEKRTMRAEEEKAIAIFNELENLKSS